MSQVLEELLSQAAQARREDRPEDARRDLVHALEIGQQSGTRTDLARVLKALAQIEQDMGGREVALSLYEQAVAIYRAEGDALSLAHTVRHVADLQRHLGNMETAELLYREALAIYRCHAETPALDLANAIRGLAILTFDTGKQDEARLLWLEARELYASVNVQAGVNEGSRRLALLERK